MADLVTIATTAVLSQFLGPSAKHLGEQALERGKQLATKATAYLAAVGREPQPVEPKILIPLVQVASLETNEILAEKWAALLANAADPSQKLHTLPSFVNILQQLTIVDAEILQVLDRLTKRFATELRPYIFIEFSKLWQATSITNFEFAVSIDNLLRLQLCTGRGTKRPATAIALPGLVNGHEVTLAEGPGKANLAISDLGLAFLDALAPPTP